MRRNGNSRKKAWIQEQENKENDKLGSTLLTIIGIEMASPLGTHRNHGDEVKDETYGYSQQLVLGTVLPMAMQGAIELGVFEIIAQEGPDAKLSASQIAAKITTKNTEAPTMLDRILRLLASYNVLGCSMNGMDKLYSLAPVSRYFVTNQDGVSFGPVMALVQDKVFMESWYQLKAAILEGGTPFDRVHGMHAFEYPGLDPRFNQVFNTAMLNYTTSIVKDILEAYKGFEHLEVLVDVGGGLGHTLEAITSKHPHVKGINFDLPQVIEHAPAYPGVEHVAGDMFESLPKADAVFMKGILHDWSDVHCLKLLKNCYQAIPDDGKVVIVEAVCPVGEEITSTAAKTTFLRDVLMMTQNPGGKERTEHEFRALATGAGFHGIRFVCFVSNLWVMEFFK
ncbi:hypothetical protein Tsubulata_018313 [Turnera subulata]|uniref:caffeate O-methyltransferase n=1 Tax=Turnera subulata TaxID=218843 RepID=A0A9Q0GHB5_9ROSI|nr:hypothetical protein Tsubulata_018313 [Turnera subulata]